MLYSALAIRVMKMVMQMIMNNGKLVMVVMKNARLLMKKNDIENQLVRLCCIYKKIYKREIMKNRMNE